MRDLSIRTKIILAVLVFFLVASVSSAMIMNAMYARATDAIMDVTLQTAHGAFDALEAAEIAKLGATLEVLRTRDDLRDLYLAGDADALFDYATPLFERLYEDYAITHWYFIAPEPDSTVFVRIHNRDKRGDLVERFTYKEAVVTKDIGMGKELGQTAFALRVVMPYHDDSGDLIGYMELGQEIDHFLAQMKEETGADYALIVRKEHLDRDSWASVREAHGERDNWDDHPTNLLVDTTTENELLISYEDDLRDIPLGGEVLGRAEEGSSVFVRGIFPVRDASGAQVGGVLVLRDITVVDDAVGMARTMVLLSGAIMSFILVMALLVILEKLVFRRLNGMIVDLEEASTRLLGGDLDVAGTIEPRSRDEIGRFEEFFANFMGIVSRALKQFMQER